MKKRLAYLFIGMVAVADLMIVALYLIGSNPFISAQAENQGKITIKLEDGRAQIMDRNFLPLTSDSSTISGLIFPSSSLLTEDEKRCIVSYNPAKDVQVAILSKLAYSDHIYPFVKSVRNGTEILAVHLLGYTNGDGDGVSGLEAGYNDFLKNSGTKITASYYVDGRGQPYDWSYPVIEKKDTGKSLVLTLDKTIQQIAEDAAEKYIPAGAVVILDVESGELLASCSSPTLDVTRVAQSTEDQGLPFNNRAFMAYNVGSVFKPVLAALAIEEGIKNFKYTCTGSEEIDGTIFKCNNLSGHGEIDMEEAICQSCNTYFIALGQQLGYKGIYSIATAIGFGQETKFAQGVKAGSGTLPRPSLIVGAGDVANISFGQGELTATPLQIARLMACIANGGVIKNTNLVMGISDGTDVIKSSDWSDGETRAFSKETADTLKEMLKTVVDRGSGMKAQPNVGGAAGKTGSAQTGWFDENGKEVVQGWFAGFYPYDHPKYAIAVITEDSLYGSTASAPAFAYICNRIYVEKGINGVDKR